MHMQYLVGSMDELRLTILGPNLFLSFFCQPMHCGKSVGYHNSKCIVTVAKATHPSTIRNEPFVLRPPQIFKHLLGSRPHQWGARVNAATIVSEGLSTVALKWPWNDLWHCLQVWATAPLFSRISEHLLKVCLHKPFIDAKDWSWTFSTMLCVTLRPPSLNLSRRQTTSAMPSRSSHLKPQVTQEESKTLHAQHPHWKPHTFECNCHVTKSHLISYGHSKLIFSNCSQALSTGQWASSTGHWPWVQVSGFWAQAIQPWVQVTRSQVQVTQPGVQVCRPWEQVTGPWIQVTGSQVWVTGT